MLVYADDVVILSQTKIYLFDVNNKLREEVKSVGLKINENKTKYTEIGKLLRRGRKNFKTVDVEEFSYRESGDL